MSKGVAQCAPVFEYTVNGRHIRAQSAEAMGRRKLEGRYREGERYEIFVDEKHPRLFVLQRRVHLLDVGLPSPAYSPPLLMTSALLFAALGVWCFFAG